MIAVASRCAAAGIDSHPQTNIIGAMPRTQRRTVAVDETGVDEAFHGHPLHSPNDQFISGATALPAFAPTPSARTGIDDRIGTGLAAATEIHG
jgi:hypothetical protein